MEFSHCKLWALTMLIVVLAALLVFYLDIERLSAIGSIASGAGSLLAVLWFSASFRTQSKQLKEQRQQFADQFHHLQETSRRDALLMAKTILDRAEERAIQCLGDIQSVSEVFGRCMSFKEEMKLLAESAAAQTVLDTHRSWIKKEGAALAILNGIKSAAEIYLPILDNVTPLDTTISPEAFYLRYENQIQSQPFFRDTCATSAAVFLAKLMTQLAPNRKMANVAFWSACVIMNGPEAIKMDKLRQDIEALEQEGRVPEIAKHIQWPNERVFRIRGPGAPDIPH